MGLDLNLPGHTTVCGMSSRLVQVTVVADLHREFLRLKGEVSMWISVLLARARRAGSMKAAAMASPKTDRGCGD